MSFPTQTILGFCGTRICSVVASWCPWRWKCPCSIPCGSTSMESGCDPKAAVAAVGTHLPCPRGCPAQPSLAVGWQDQPSAASGCPLTARQTLGSHPQSRQGWSFLSLPEHPPFLLISTVSFWAVFTRRRMLKSVLCSFVPRTPSSHGP